LLWALSFGTKNVPCIGELILILQISGSQSVLRGSQGIRCQFPGDPWVHFCYGYFEIYPIF